MAWLSYMQELGKLGGGGGEDTWENMSVFL